jgi:hypothetical protein
MNAAVTRYTRAAAPQAPAAACWPRAATAAVLQRCRPVACGVPRSIHIASIQLHHRYRSTEPAASLFIGRLLLEERGTHRL